MTTKHIEFQGRKITTQEAREIIGDLMVSVAAVDPIVTDSPQGIAFRASIDPRWYCEIATPSPSPVPGLGHNINGASLCFRDNAIGWQGFLLPWNSAAKLAAVLTNQLSAHINSVGR